MTPSWLPRSLARLFILFVAAVSGTYLVVYLYRWEWNRAVISGLFFLAAEVAYVGSSLRGEISGLRNRIDTIEAASDRLPAPPPVRQTAQPNRPFEWLRESASQTNVFVPVLLGAGVILSALAFVVERVAAIVARSVAPHSVARPGVHLELPPGGLLGPMTETPSPDHARTTGPRWVRGGRLLGLVILALSLTVAIGLIAEATQSRPSPHAPGSNTVVELRIDQRDSRPPIEAAEALTVACQASLRDDSEITSIAAIPGGHVRFEVTPALGELGRRRLFGCLEDATIDLVQAHVVGWTTATATPAPDQYDVKFAASAVVPGALGPVPDHRASDTSDIRPGAVG